MQADVASAMALLRQADRVAITQRYLRSVQAAGRPAADLQSGAARLSWTLDRTASLLEADAAGRTPVRPGRCGDEGRDEPIFDAAVPIVAQALARTGEPEPELAAAKAIHQALMDRLAAESAPGRQPSRPAEGPESERLRLARQLHDVLAPLLAAGLHQLELCELDATSGGTQVPERLAAVRAALQESMAAVRSGCALLRERPGPAGLAESLRRFLDGADAGCRVRLELGDGLELLSARYTDELFLIIREALRNAFAHSGAEEVVVTAGISATTLLATVRDDGRSFEVPAGEDARGGQGLTSMRERAWLLGGSLTVDSRPGLGTVVRLEVPLTGPAAGWRL